MSNEELIINEGANSEIISSHYEIFVYRNQSLKKLGGVYSKIMDDHYVLFCYGLDKSLFGTCPFGVRDLSIDKKELSDLLSEKAKLFGDLLTKDKERIMLKYKEILRKHEEGNILDRF